MDAATPGETPIQMSAEQFALMTGENEVLRKQAGELRDQLMRAVAETENVRKRAQREVEESSKYAIANFAREIVGVLENLHRAYTAIPEAAKEQDPVLKSFAEGIEMTLRDQESMLGRFGVKRIWPLGEPFDHNYHQAVVQVEDPSHPPGVVTQVMQAGYTIHDRLLNPAMVAVSKRPEAPPQPAGRVDTEA